MALTSVVNYTTAFPREFLHNQVFLPRMIRCQNFLFFLKQGFSVLEVILIAHQTKMEKNEDKHIDHLHGGAYKLHLHALPSGSYPQEF